LRDSNLCSELTELKGEAHRLNDVIGLPICMYCWETVGSSMQGIRWLRTPTGSLALKLRQLLKKALSLLKCYLYWLQQEQIW